MAGDDPPRGRARFCLRAVERATAVSHPAQSVRGAYIVDSRGIGNDVCLAWPGAEVAVMGASGAVQILYRGLEAGARADQEHGLRGRLLESVAGLGAGAGRPGGRSGRQPDCPVRRPPPARTNGSWWSGESTTPVRNRVQQGNAICHPFVTDLRCFRRRTRERIRHDHGRGPPHGRLCICAGVLPQHMDLRYRAMRFRRVLKGLALDAHAATTAWRAYYGLEIDPISESFVVL